MITTRDPVGDLAERHRQLLTPATALTEVVGLLTEPYRRFAERMAEPYREMVRSWARPAWVTRYGVTYANRRPGASTRHTLGSHP